MCDMYDRTREQSALWASDFQAAGATVQKEKWTDMSNYTRKHITKTVQALVKVRRSSVYTKMAAATAFRRQLDDLEGLLAVLPTINASQNPTTAPIRPRIPERTAKYTNAWNAISKERER
jgi:hypothetical protein